MNETSKIVGRESEIAVLKEALKSDQAELIAVYGRRRVGKTFLIRSVYSNQMVFDFTGVKDASLSDQLKNFSRVLVSTFKPSSKLQVAKSWIDAFWQLAELLEKDLNKGKKVIFLDEFPWLDTPRSKFLQAFDHFWNAWASRFDHIIIVICGSAASWMIQNILRNKGGLHNRLTRRIRLMPFSLYETERLLIKNGINLDRYQIIELYMAMGGIPQYLKEIKAGESSTQAIDRLCFNKDGPLFYEFQELYVALFDRADKHLEVVKALANKPSGLSRNELIEIGGVKTGGTLTTVLDELMESGFIIDYFPFGKKHRDIIFKLSD
jgi:AAA+ ATPase superfamily predicted ATPase